MSIATRPAGAPKPSEHSSERWPRPGRARIERGTIQALFIPVPERDCSVMTVTFLTAALLMQAPPPELEIPTARALAEACRTWVDTKSQRTGTGRRGEALMPSGNRCQREALMMMTSAEEKSPELTGSGS